MQVLFLVPDHQSPSWGIGMIYHLVQISLELGIDAKVTTLTELVEPPTWLDLELKIYPLQHVIAGLCKQDLIIVPEIMAQNSLLASISVRKIVLVQGSAMIPLGEGDFVGFQSLGFISAITIMPHVVKVIQAFWPIRTYLVPPFVASYFFEDGNGLKVIDRKQEILLFPKPGYKEAGYFDYEIVWKVLSDIVKKINDSKLPTSQKWEIVELRNLSHRDLADRMKKATFFINTNCFEAFNSTVPEALAAGCIVFCYEAFGGQDYLENGKNAFVFNNNYVYPMLSKVKSTIEDFEENLPRLDAIQQEGFLTAERYRRSDTKEALAEFYRNIG